MWYPADQKVKARAALLGAGTRSMKVAGFNGIGVDGLAAEADVTSGAFYSNFANKEAMLEAIIEAAVGEPFVSDTESGTKAERRAKLDRRAGGAGGRGARRRRPRTPGVERRCADGGGGLDLARHVRRGYAGQGARGRAGDGGRAHFTGQATQTTGGGK
jgi:AcrR family transcriptional regulator